MKPFPRGLFRLSWWRAKALEPKPSLWFDLPMTIPLPQGTLFGINVTEGLDRCMDDREFYWTQLLTFQEKYGGSAEVIKVFLKNGALDEAELLAHTMKGTAGMLGLEEVQATATRLNIALKAACAKRILSDSLFVDLEDVRLALERMRAGIRKMAEGMKPQ
jgi:HPt (histidine-containing phosphotransfer) domain-containing protein